MNRIPNRNPFVAVCEYASLGNWCWKISCTTCGHSGFRVAFSKIIHGEHPDDDSFWPNGNKADSELYKQVDKYSDFYHNRADNNSAQLKLAKIVARAKISDLRDSCKFPDWLGYIGLVIYHCPDNNAKRILSKSLLPQFIEMINNNDTLTKYFSGKLERGLFLDISDMEKMERSDFKRHMKCPKCFSVNVRVLEIPKYDPQNIFGFTISDYAKLKNRRCNKCSNEWREFKKKD